MAMSDLGEDWTDPKGFYKDDSGRALVGGTPAQAMEGSGGPPLDGKSKLTNQLLDFQQKLRKAVSSSSCRSLKHLYVAVMLKVADQSGQGKNKVCFETTIPVSDFYRQIKEIAAVI